MWLYKVIEWIALNLDTVALIAIVIFVLSLTSAFTRSIRSVKDGIKEGMTPLGAFVLLILIIIVFVVYRTLTSL